MQPGGGRRSGFFVTLEGPEGSGKSTQAQRLASELTASGFRCTVTREPGGTALGEEIRQILLHSPELAPVPAADALLFNAARAQLVGEVIAPALARGEVVICDRFTDSTLAYQGYGAGMPLDELRALACRAAGDLVPDLTLLIDLPVEEGLRRKLGDAETTRFEDVFDEAFHRRVRDGFLTLAAAEPGRFVVIDGLGTLESIGASVLRAVLARLEARDEVHAVNGSGDAGSTAVGSSEPKARSLRMDR
jgi:dTMP kinase